LRIVVSTRLPSAGGKPDDATATAIDRTVALLEQAGHRLVHEDPPYPRDLALRFARRWLPGLAESASGLNLDELEPRTRSMVQIGHLLDRLRLASQHDETFTRTMLDWFSSRDLLLTPTLAFPPPPLGQWQSGGWLQTALSVNRWLCTVPWNLVDFPALSLPAGLSKDGLPIGLQLVAPPGGERLLLSLARQLELLQPSPRLPAR
jgi:amidase